MPNIEHPVREVIAASCAIQKLQGGYIKKGTTASGVSNSDMLYEHFYGENQVDVTSDDVEQANAIIELLTGLAWKKMERDLSDWEQKTLKLVTSDTVRFADIGIASSLPNVYESKKIAEDWEKRERELGETSEFQDGEDGSFNIVVEYLKWLPNSSSYLVVGSLDNKHIIKFFTHKKIEVSNAYTVTGKIKLPHAISPYSKFKETVLRSPIYIKKI